MLSIYFQLMRHIPEKFIDCDSFDIESSSGYLRSKKANAHEFHLEQYY